VADRFDGDPRGPDPVASALFGGHRLLMRQAVNSELVDLNQNVLPGLRAAQGDAGEIAALRTTISQTPQIRKYLSRPRAVLQARLPR